eukprot:SAG22_NODE_2755_length_2243_cov_1.502332_2_plen_83_part_00
MKTSWTQTWQFAEKSGVATNDQVLNSRHWLPPPHRRRTPQDPSEAGLNELTARVLAKRWRNSGQTSRCNEWPVVGNFLLGKP